MARLFHYSLIYGCNNSLVPLFPPLFWCQAFFSAHPDCLLSNFLLSDFRTVSVAFLCAWKTTLETCASKTEIPGEPGI